MMEVRGSYGDLEAEVKVKVHAMTSLLVQQLMALPAVLSVQLSGHLQVLVNGCLSVSIVSPSQYLCASGGHDPAPLPPCSSGLPLAPPPAPHIPPQPRSFRDNTFADRGVDGVSDSLYPHQGSMNTPLISDLDSTAHTTANSKSLSCSQSADDFLHSILTSSVLGLSEQTHYLDLSQPTADPSDPTDLANPADPCDLLAEGQVKVTNRSAKKSAAPSSGTVPLPPQRMSTKRPRKRKYPQKLSAPDEDVRKEEVSPEKAEQRGEGELQCGFCHKVYPGNKRKAFHKHVRNHRHSTQCHTCGKYLSSADSLKRHQIGMHRQEKPYCCEQCGERFSFHHSYKLHVYKHSGSRHEACPHCAKTYLTHTHLKAHMMSVHGKKDKVPNRFQCEVCGRTLHSAASLKTHMFTHSDHKPFHCDLCHKGFSYKSALLLHKKLVHVAGCKYHCETCHKAFKTPQVLNIHKRRHGAQELGQFVCEQCGRRFLFECNMTAHVASVHHGVCPYTCKDCGKGFKLLSSLYSHRFTHTSERPFQCSECPKVFKTKSACSAHERRHNASRDYECQHCGARFPDKGGLDKHTRSIHAISKVFQCSLCGKSGPRMDNMRTHIKSHTGRDKTAEELNSYIKEIKK